MNGQGVSLINLIPCLFRGFKMGTILRNTFLILEATKVSERSALSDDQKEIYNLIISAGKVSIDADSKVYKALLAMFGADSVTMETINNLYPTPETNIPEE